MSGARSTLVIGTPQGGRPHLSRSALGQLRTPAATLCFVRFRGQSRLGFRAAEGPFIAKNGLLGATQQGHCSPRSYSRSTACGRSRGRQSGAASMIGTRQATYDRDIALALCLARSRRLRTCLVPPKWRNLEPQHAISGESQLRSSHVPLQKSGIGKLLLDLNGDSQIAIRPAAIGWG